MPTTASNLAETVARWEAGPAALRAAWARVPVPARLWRPAPGKWSAHEVVLHCADTAAVGHMRVRFLLAEDDPLIVAWDQDRWPRALDYHAQPVEAAFALIDAVHAAAVPLFRRLTAADLARPGRHTELGPVTVGSWLEYNAEHLHVHARQIGRNVAAYESRKLVSDTD